MKDVFRTLPGFYHVASPKTDPTIPKGKLRIYSAILTAVDIDANENGNADLDTSFRILAGIAEEDPRFARALLRLGDHVEQNKTHIKHHAAQ